MTIHADEQATVPVWHVAVRLSHWVVAAIVLFNLFNESGPLHRYAGYVAFGVVFARFAYGLTRPAGDAAHIGLPLWSELVQHASDLRHGRVHRTLGHNPAGLCMALVLWLLVVLLGLTGWMSQLDQFWGEAWLADTHELLAEALQVCVVLHWLGVILMSRLQKENLLKAMITGRKPKL
jgi:cytochrome b